MCPEGIDVIAISGNQWHLDVPRGYAIDVIAISGNQWQSMAISDNQWQSVAPRCAPNHWRRCDCNQWQSVTISGNQWHLDVPRPIGVDGRDHLAQFLLLDLDAEGTHHILKLAAVDRARVVGIE